MAQWSFLSGAHTIIPTQRLKLSCMWAVVLVVELSPWTTPTSQGWAMSHCQRMSKLDSGWVGMVVRATVTWKLLTIVFCLFVCLFVCLWKCVMKAITCRWYPSLSLVPRVFLISSSSCVPKKEMSLGTRLPNSVLKSFSFLNMEGRCTEGLWAH